MITCKLKQIVSLCYVLIFLISAFPSECIQYTHTHTHTNAWSSDQINRMSRDILKSQAIKHETASAPQVCTIPT